MGTRVTIFPADWRFKPTDEQIENVVEFLRREGVLGNPKLAAGPRTWDGGPGVGKLMVSDRNTIWISVRASDRLGVHAGGDFTAECPSCRVEVADWGDLMNSFYESNVEPEYACLSCGTSTKLTKLAYPYGGAITHFVISMLDADVLPPDKPVLVWELEKLLGTELAMTMYHT